MKLMKFKAKSKGFLLMLCIVLAVSGLSVGSVTVEAASSNPYLVKVNKQMNTVTIYGKDSKGQYTVPVKAMVCSTGSATKVGTFSTPAKYRWHPLMGNVWGQYCTRIVGGILFHSVWYYEKDPSTLSGVQYNKLGTTCSHGCVRLTVADAKWIYDNCPLGTTVVVYNNSNPGPLGKPTAQKVNFSKGWDPTDIWSPGNPYVKNGQAGQTEQINKEPTLSGVKNQTVEFGGTVDILKGVSARSYDKKDLTKKIKVSGTINTEKAGNYSITYSITDNGKTASQKAVFTVKADTAKPTLAGIKDRIVGPNVKVDKAFVLKEVTGKIGSQSVKQDKIQVKISQPDKGSYQVEYTLTNPNNGIVAKDKAKIYVDSEAPVLKGVADRDISYLDKVDKKLALSGISAQDNYSELVKADIQVEITETKPGVYTVAYQVADKVGNVATATATLNVSDIYEIAGPLNKTITPDTMVTEGYALDGVTVKYKGTVIDGAVPKVTISELKDGVYTLTYSYEAEDGAITTKIITLTVD